MNKKARTETETEKETEKETETKKGVMKGEKIMKNTLRKTKEFFKSEKGQGMVEYGLIIALVAIVVIAAIVLLGGNLTGIFTKTADALSTATSTAS